MPPYSKRYGENGKPAPKRIGLYSHVREGDEKCLLEATEWPTNGENGARSMVSAPPHKIDSGVFSGTRDQ